MKEWTLFDHNLKRLFKDCNDDRVILMKVKSRFDRGITKDLSEFESIIEKIFEKDKKNSVYCDVICAYATRCPLTPEIISKLKDAIQINPSHVHSLKLWSYLNFGCIKIAKNEEKQINYASNAIQGFSKLIKISSPSLHYLCQFISIFFRYGPKLSNFKEAAENLTSLTDSHVIQIIPQLLIQFNNPNKDIREVVSTIIKKFAVNNFQALAMPLCFMSHRSIYSNQSFNDFMCQMMNDSQQIMKEAKNFADSMVSVAITDVEKVLQLFDIVINYQHPNNHISKIKNIFNRIKSIINQPHYGYVADVLSRTTVQFINNRLDENKILPTTNVNLGELYKNTSAHIIDVIYLQPEIYADIDINEMKIPNFPSSSLSLVVPGFYIVNENPVTIERIFNILKTIPSQKRPRKLRIIGSNGKKYKYLLKGREDLRLDHRVMQLFSLINCILQEDKFSSQKKLQINRFPIIPLAINAGLIAWAERGETLFSLINWYRQIIQMSNGNEESNIKLENQNRLNIEQNFIHFLFENKIDSLKLSSIQKLELYRDLCSLSPDNDLSEALWLQSKNAEIWHNQITNYAQSNGLMSIIGYIVGIGDRHPSNILVKKDTGNVVHIDFSDVFEKANLRPFAHETVPFRLTRMLVRAFGPSGVHGVFEITAQKVLYLMRKNKETILSFLDIFIQDPITDTLWYSNFDNNMISDDNLNLNLSLNSVSESILNYIGDNYLDSNNNCNLKVSILKKAIDRVNEKLNGCDLGGENLDPIKQVNKLIDIATNEMNLSQMFYGWAPYW